MLNDSTNQIPGSSSNPGSSTQPSFNQMPYYPNYQPQFAPKIGMVYVINNLQMHQQQPQQLPNQFTTSQPYFEQQSHHLEVEDTEDEEEPLSTPTSKPSRAARKKSMLKKQRKRTAISEDPKTGCDQKRDTFWYKIQNVYNKEAKKKGFTERTKNMLTGKWTPMNTTVLKFNQLVQETAVHSGENDDDHMSRVMLYATVGGEFKHRSAWLFLKGKHKWTNPDSTLQRRSRLLGTDEEPEHFEDDELPRPPGLQRLAKSQRTGLTRPLALVIPAENIVAAFHGYQKTVFAISKSPSEAQIFLEPFVGLGERPSFENGMSEDVLELKVGSFTRGLFLLHSECLESNYIVLRVLRGLTHLITAVWYRVRRRSISLP
ncbi:glutathione S-transferase T3-like protein [Tanacetum coccineum]